MSFSINIAAVIVIYEEHLLATSTYQSFLVHSDIPFLVYDNSRESQSIVLNEKSAYVHDPTNGGVSKAYNAAIRWAKSIKATHLLLLDSDSNFPSDALDKYKVSAREHKNTIVLPELISSKRKISPFYFYSGKSRYGEGIKVGPIKLGKVLAINAGSLFPLGALSEGSFNEKLPLDWSDLYIFRKMARNEVKAVHIELTVEHGLSEHETLTISATKYRFNLQLKGIPEVGNSILERLQMYWWIFLKALKLSARHRSFWFIKHYLGLHK